MTLTGPSPTLFFDTMIAYQRTEALRTAIELDLFTAVCAGKSSVDDLAAACQSSPRGIRILADTLTMIGFLSKHEDRYVATDDSKCFLDRKSPAYLGGATNFLLTPEIRGSFSQLTTAVRQGGTAISDEGTVSFDNPIWIAFARAMGPLMQLPAMMMTERVGGDSQRPLKILDVAAGHGLFGITIAERYPNARVTALDWPNVLQVASENARDRGVADRHRLLPGSAFDVDWGGPYDLVLLTNFLHHFDPPACESIASKSMAALAPGGRVMTLEFIPNPDRISPASTAMFALTMLATTGRGDAYTFAEYEAMFQKAGFHRSEFQRLLPTNQQLVISYKSAN